MAARLNRHHAEEIRQKIQASVIIQRFTKHVLGKLKMSSTQIAAGTALLDRSVPKLQQIQHLGELTHKHVSELSDNVLADIATRGRERVIEASSSSQDSSELH